MKSKRMAIGFFVLACLAFSLVLTPVTRAQENKWKDISTSALKAMLDKGENFCLVNVLPRIIHDNNYIERSLNIPIGKIRTSPEMPKDKNKPIVFYCLGRG